MKKNSPPFTIFKLEDDIALIKYTGVDMNLNSVIDLYDEIEKVGHGKKIAILNVFPNYMRYDEEALKYSASARPPKILFASAIVIESISIQLIMMMFMKFNKQLVTRQVFNSKPRALIWLREMRGAHFAGLL